MMLLMVGGLPFIFVMTVEIDDITKLNIAVDFDNRPSKKEKKIRIRCSGAITYVTNYVNIYSSF